MKTITWGLQSIIVMSLIISLASASQPDIAQLLDLATFGFASPFVESSVLGSGGNETNGLNEFFFHPVGPGDDLGLMATCGSTYLGTADYGLCELTNPTTQGACEDSYYTDTICFEPPVNISCIWLDDGIFPPHCLGNCQVCDVACFLAGTKIITVNNL